MHLLDFLILLPMVLGIIVGMVLALSGAGGGIIAVPLLVFFLNLSIQQAAPTGLVAVGLAAGVGAFLAFREGKLRYRAAGLMGLFGILTAPIGIFVAQKLPGEPLMFGFALILAWLAFKTFHQKNVAPQPSTPDSDKKTCQIDPKTGRFSWNKPCAAALALTGVISGFLSGLLGVGGGFVIVPTLSRYSDLRIQSAIATSLGVIAFVALSGITAAAMQGSINWEITLPFAVGALTGMLVGNKVSAKVNSQRLQQNFAVVCLIAATLLVIKGCGVQVFH